MGASLSHPTNALLAGERLRLSDVQGSLTAVGALDYAVQGPLVQWACGVRLYPTCPFVNPHLEISDYGRVIVVTEGGLVGICKCCNFYIL